MKLKLFFCLTLVGLVLSDTYVLESKLLSYDAAVKNCKDTYGGVIAKVPSTLVNDHLKKMLVAKKLNSAYIGLEAQLPVWKWNDGTPLTNAKWATNEPNGLVEDRAELLKTGFWNDIRKTTTRPSFCFVKGVSLITASGGKSWEDAEATCEKAVKGWLSKIESLKKSNQYAAMLKAEGQTTAWFGAKQYGKFEKNPKVGWLYLDSTAVSYTNWAPNEPNEAGGGEDCGQLYQSGKWNDLGCGAKLTAFFCDDNQPISTKTVMENFEFVSITSPQTVWYNTPTFYLIMGLILFGVVMFYQRSRNVKGDPLLNHSAQYSSI